MPPAASKDVFRAVADPTRRRILDLLAESEQSVGELVLRFSMSQPAISQHLRVLYDAGLVGRHREGRLKKYRLRPERLRRVHDWSAHYAHFWTDKLGALGRYLDKPDH
ncbi:MAG TPA: metalloregulator ArsR/SmtB family transcription factor [Planctomycetota bacterium]|nr:metalloregulator ArsR/SmtB family transcription factor [Planctomycetota bacterium]